MLLHSHQVLTSVTANAKLNFGGALVLLLCLLHGVTPSAVQTQRNCCFETPHKWGFLLLGGKHVRRSINPKLDSSNYFNGGNMANNKSFVVLIFVLCLNLISTNIYAANVGGWTLGGGVAQGASTVYEGTKKVVIDGVDYIKKGTAKITPPATSVAKVLARGAAGYALSVAVEQLLGSVDWVLDPANNQIKYKEVSQDVTGSHIQVQGQIGSTAIGACQNWIDKVYLKNNPSHKARFKSVSGFTLIAQGIHSFTCTYEVDFDKSDGKDQFYPYTTSGQVRDLVEVQEQKIYPPGNCGSKKSFQTPNQVTQTLKLQQLLLLLILLLKLKMIQQKLAYCQSIRSI